MLLMVIDFVVIVVVTVDVKLNCFLGIYCNNLNLMMEMKAKEVKLLANYSHLMAVMQVNLWMYLIDWTFHLFPLPVGPYLFNLLVFPFLSLRVMAMMMMRRMRMKMTKYYAECLCVSVLFFWLTLSLFLLMLESSN